MRRYRVRPNLFGGYDVYRERSSGCGCLLGLMLFFFIFTPLFWHILGFIILAVLVFIVFVRLVASKNNAANTDEETRQYGRSQVVNEDLSHIKQAEKVDDDI